MLCITLTICHTNIMIFCSKSQEQDEFFIFCYNFIRMAIFVLGEMYMIAVCDIIFYRSENMFVFSLCYNYSRKIYQFNLRQYVESLEPLYLKHPSFFFIFWTELLFLLFSSCLYRIVCPCLPFFVVCKPFDGCSSISWFRNFVPFSPFPLPVWWLLLPSAFLFFFSIFFFCFCCCFFCRFCV